MEQTKEKQIFEQMPVPKAVFTLAVPTVISQLIVLIEHQKSDVRYRVSSFCTAGSGFMMC